MKIGAFPDMTIEQARIRAQELNGVAARKEDPSAATKRSRDEMTFGELGTWWVQQVKNRKRSWDYDRQILETHFEPWKSRRLSSITREAVEQLHAKISIVRESGGQLYPGPEKNRRRLGGLGAANRAMELARAMFTRAIRKGVFTGSNPVTGLEWNKKKSRRRRLMPAEIEGFLTAVETEPNVQMREFVLILLFTAARQGSVCAMRWDQIDFVGATWTIPAETAKNGEEQTLPLGGDEIAILERRKAGSKSPWVFPAESKSGHMMEPQYGWRKIVKRAGMADLHMHDLRRTLGSWMADTGSSLHLIGETLGHTSPWVTAVYARLALGSVREGKDRAIQAIKLARGGQAVVVEPVDDITPVTRGSHQRRIRSAIRDGKPSERAAILNRG
jgi:integrase